MNTFLPYRSFKKSAECLDRRRLGKQRVECLQILKIISGKDKNSRWKNHPCVKMWKNYPHALLAYGINICDEWTKRGYKDTCKYKMMKIFGVNRGRIFLYYEPLFLGNRKFHRAMQSNLKRKDPKHYNFNVPDNLPYIWP